MACMGHGVFGANVIEPVGVVRESGLARALTPLRSLVAPIALQLDLTGRLNYVT